MLEGELEAVCEQILTWHRQRVFAMDQRKRAGNAIGAFLRVSQGWHRELPKADREPMEKKAQEAIAAGEARSALMKLNIAVACLPLAEQPTLLRKQAKAREKLKAQIAADPMPGHARIVDRSIAASDGFVELEEEAAERMEALAETLPVWGSWAYGIKGLGARALAVIIGEAGNLDGYDDRSQLWKRLGLALVDGRRQGGLAKNAKAETWVEHGYSKRRRSVMWVIGDVLVKQSKGPYRAVYDARKAYELDAAVLRGQIVEPASKRTKSDPARFMSAMHVHRRAQRYLEKKLLRDLLREWKVASRATLRLPQSGASEAVPSDAGEMALLPSRQPDIGVAA